jgi:gluconolactonase
MTCRWRIMPYCASHARITADGSLLFTEQDAGDGQLVKIDKDDKVSADSMSVDNDGRLYVGTGMAGVQVISAKGERLGTIRTPLGAQATAFAGRDKKTLYIVGGGAVWKVAMIAQGIQGRAK